jgi:hypothetical protein
MKKHHSDKNYIFWPDLARAPYSKEVVSSINKYITYVPAHLNTSKAPKFFELFSTKILRERLKGHDGGGIDTWH